MLPLAAVYQECFPYWFGPYLGEQTVSDFRVGNRVMNVNSTRRIYIPFGARGTVIGKTEDNLLIMFDEAFIAGTNIYSHCP